MVGDFFRSDETTGALRPGTAAAVLRDAASNIVLLAVTILVITLATFLSRWLAISFDLMKPQVRFAPARRPRCCVTQHRISSCSRLPYWLSRLPLSYRDGWRFLSI